MAPLNHAFFTIFSSRLVAGSPDSSHITFAADALHIHDLDLIVDWKNISHLSFSAKTTPRPVSAAIELAKAVLISSGLESGALSSTVTADIYDGTTTHRVDIRVGGRFRLTKEELRVANTFSSWLTSDPTHAMVLKDPHEVIHRFKLAKT